jgi:hypothetical protein
VTGPSESSWGTTSWVATGGGALWLGPISGRKYFHRSINMKIKYKIYSEKKCKAVVVRYLAYDADDILHTGFSRSQKIINQKYQKA